MDDSGRDIKGNWRKPSRSSKAEKRRIDEEDRDYFGFITHFGLYRWKRVPYGWRNAGANFCYLLDRVSGGLKYQILVSYVDDVCVLWGVTFEKHLRAININFDRTQAWGLKLYCKNFVFDQELRLA